VPEAPIEVALPVSGPVESSVMVPSPAPNSVPNVSQDGQQGPNDNPPPGSLAAALAAAKSRGLKKVNPTPSSSLTLTSASASKNNNNSSAHLSGSNGSTDSVSSSGSLFDEMKNAKLKKATHTKQPSVDQNVMSPAVPERKSFEGSSTQIFRIPRLPHSEGSADSNSSHPELSNSSDDKASVEGVPPTGLTLLKQDSQTKTLRPSEKQANALTNGVPLNGPSSNGATNGTGHGQKPGQYVHRPSINTHFRNMMKLRSKTLNDDDDDTEWH